MGSNDSAALEAPAEDAGERALEALFGPRRQELAKAVPMTLVYAAVFLTGVVGNVATCIVIARHRYMHTATNFYLVNLAVSDLLLVSIQLLSGQPHRLQLATGKRATFFWLVNLDMFILLRVSNHTSIWSTSPSPTYCWLVSNFYLVNLVVSDDSDLLLVCNQLAHASVNLAVSDLLLVNW